MHDYAYSFNEPMTNMYFWHPAYDAYPVAGISYEQACAYLHWLTESENKNLAAKKKNYRLSFELPSEVEWEIASNTLNIQGKPEAYTQYAFHLNDNSWLTDLVLESKDNYPEQKMGRTDSSGEKESITRTNLLYFNAHWNDRFYGNYIIDGMFHTGPANLETAPAKIKAGDGRKELYEIFTDALAQMQLDNNKISFMGGNVSEWMKEDFNNCRGAFYWRLMYLKTAGTPDARVQYEIENYFYKWNSPRGKLVRGANWSDERFSARLGKNTAGTNTKRFINPEEAHSTLGFRYAVHILPDP